MVTSAYDINPILKNLKPTNSAARKAILESTANQHKISTKVSNGLKVNSATLTLSKKSLFDGLEEFDRRSSQIPSTSSLESDSVRRVSWLHSNLDKVAQQNLEAKIAMQGLVSSGKIKSSNFEKHGTSPSILHQDLNRSNISALQHKNVHFPGLNANDSILSTKSFLDDTNADISLINTDPHPTGIILQRSGYYTIPPLDKLTDFMSDDGKCIVPNFTVTAKDMEMFISVMQSMLPA